MTLISGKMVRIVRWPDVFGLAAMLGATVALHLVYPEMAIADQNYDYGVALFNRRDYANAEKYFDMRLKVAPKDANAAYYKASCVANLGDPWKAKGMFEYIVEEYPTTVAAQLALANIKKIDPTYAKTLPASTSQISAAFKQEVRAKQTSQEKKAIGLHSDSELRRQVAFSAASAAPSDRKSGDRPFSPEDIARDGAGGIDQFSNPNCWFEASMAALAELPRGQKLLSNMIRYGQKGGYVVRFPGDGVEYEVTEKALDEADVHDKALWASIIECAQCQKFPNQHGGLLEEGLGCLSGAKAEILDPAKATHQEISAFIGGAVSSKNPIIAATYPSYQPLALPNHAYTIIGFDPAKEMITIRNPHGAKSKTFKLPDDPNHLHFEQLSDGVFKMSINLFRKYFDETCRSFI